MGSLASPAVSPAQVAVNEPPPPAPEPRPPDAPTTAARKPARMLKGGLALALIVAVAAVAGWGVWQGWLPQLAPWADPAAPDDPAKQPDPPTGSLAAYELPRLVTHVAGLDAGTLDYKPGHWMPLAIEVQANRDDLRGAVEAGFAAADGLPAPIPPQGDRVGIERTLVVAKGQRRVVETLAYAPLSEAPHRFEARLLDRDGNRLASAGVAARPLAAHQYFILVLAREPERYRYLAKQPSLAGVVDELLPHDEQADYVPLFPRPSARAAAPSHLAGWTSTAYVVWDEYPADTWDEFQQRALVDWLHWGGQLIVSGPNSLDALRGTFLAPWLPATAGPMETLADAHLEALRAWDGLRPLELPARPNLTRLALASPGPDQRGGTVLVGSAERPLVVEGAVGRGRVVVTAFRLNEPALMAWSGYDQLLNAALLRRGVRRFIVLEGGEALGVAWREGTPFDARRNTSVRFFARDARWSTPPRVASASRYVQFPSAPLPELVAAGAAVPDAPPSLTQNGYWPQPEAIAPQEVPRGPGVAAWNDFGDAADAARSALRDAAGVVVPGRGFVLGVLAAYVVVLVPLNGLVCRLLGRVEWAWIAAPVVAVGFTALVVRLADLDIGFARTSTVLTVVEVQPGYARAHATRYTAIYNSLAARYTLGSTDPGAALLPMSMEAPREPLLARLRREPVTDAAPATAVARLENLYVPSNSALVVHGEQMLDLGGTFDWVRLADDHYRLVNRTPFELHGAAVVGPSQAAWIGTLAPQVPADVWLGERPEGSLWREWHAPAAAAAGGQRSMGPGGSASAAPATTAPPPEGGAETGAPEALAELFALAYDDVPWGELRLVGYTRDAVPGQSLEPATSETRRAALFVVHLTSPWRKPPARDVQPARAAAPGQP